MKTFKNKDGIRTQGLEQRKALILYAKEKGVPFLDEETTMKDIDDGEDFELFPTIVFRNDVVFGLDLARETYQGLNPLTEEEFKAYCDGWKENPATPAKEEGRKELIEFLGIDTTESQKELIEDFGNREEGVTTIEIIKRIESDARLTERAKIYVALWIGKKSSPQTSLESLLAAAAGE